MGRAPYTLHSGCCRDAAVSVWPYCCDVSSDSAGAQSWTASAEVVCSCACGVQDNEIKEYKHQLKAERRARKAAEAWLRSELKSRVWPKHTTRLLVGLHVYHYRSARKLTVHMHPASTVKLMHPKLRSGSSDRVPVCFRHRAYFACCCMGL